MTDKALPPPPDHEMFAHIHKWVAVGIIHIPNGDLGLIGETIPAVVQSCHCGEVQAVVVAAAVVR